MMVVPRSRLSRPGATFPGRERLETRKWACPHRSRWKHIASSVGLRRASSDSAGQSATAGDVPVLRARKGGRRSGWRTRSEGFTRRRLRRRDARRSGGDRGAFDRPRACSSRGWSSMPGASARPTSASTCGSPRTGRRLGRMPRWSARSSPGAWCCRSSSDRSRSFAPCCGSGGSRRSSCSRWPSSRRRTAPRRSSSTRIGRASFVSRICRSTPATRPVIRRLRSRSTAASCSCSRPGSRAASFGRSPGRSSWRW